jgi:hypothetical protein
VYNNHPRNLNPKMALIVKLALFTSHSCYKRSKLDYKIMAVIDRWWLFGGLTLNIFNY